MSLLTREDYLSSPKLLLVQQRRRLARQLHFSIANVEPRAKHPIRPYLAPNAQLLPVRATQGSLFADRSYLASLACL